MTREAKSQKQGNIKKRGKIKISKYAPICKWLPKYSKYQAISDAIAGITLGLTMIPQSIAYATLAGLSAQYGLYSSFLGGFLYAIFGSVKEISIGPTSLMAILTMEFTKGTNPDFAILLAFLAGCVEFLMGLLDLGFLVDFISLPVTAGFTSATSVIIIVSQIKGLLGLKFQSANLIDQMVKICQNLMNVKLGDTLLGVSTILILLCLKNLSNVKFTNDGLRHVIVIKALWFFSVGRNALIVLISSVITFYLHQAGQTPFVLSGTVQSGLPSIKLPNFTTVVQNQTYSFMDICSHLGSGIIVIPLVSVLANVAIAKVFSSGSGFNASQEMRTLGLCNLLGSFVSSMPICGAFTRSAVSHASGIQTPMAGIYSGILTMLALSFLTPYFYYIPKTVLSAVLISAVIFLIDWKIVQQLWRGSKRDAIASIGTFFVCIILNVEAGLLVGIVFNILYLLYLSARPAIQVTERMVTLELKYLSVQPDVGLFFPAVDFIVNKISEIADERASDNIPIVVDCQRFRGVDYTAIKGLERLSKDINERNQCLWFVNLNSKVTNTIQKLGDLNNLKILKDESEVIAILCEHDSESIINFKFVKEKPKKEIPMQTIITPIEVESLLTKEHNINPQTKNRSS
ncbi:PREDICTED: sodium-independent sulfate anion transporter-like [Ceratosolen solmsi marchali]|uniref:Sodium-independent sulfate anion transporter-like n=1 Tax=Ceratosolen solmsi marchali TaxID=326594 RepID=A0AAJ6YGM9_9HYME|nr:PREDICTED: sodium-independent sulfate anion transporter-like [Ceratosolen solmsi marchali]